MLLGITQNYELLLLHLNTTPDLVWLSENHHQNQETIQYTIFNSNWLTVTTEWCRCGDMSLCHWVSMFNILMSMSVLGCGGVYSAADCWQQTRLGWAGHHRPPPRLGGGRADGQKAGPLDQPLSGPWQLWPGPRMWARGRYYLDKNPRTFPWCCIMHGIFRAN